MLSMQGASPDFSAVIWAQSVGTGAVFDELASRARILVFDSSAPVATGLDPFQPLTPRNDS
jgi:hypothetical protein